MDSEKLRLTAKYAKLHTLQSFIISKIESDEIDIPEKLKGFQPIKYHVRQRYQQAEKLHNVENKKQVDTSRKDLPQLSQRKQNKARDASQD